MCGTILRPSVLLGRMTKKSLVLTDPAEAAVVNEIVVRLVGPEEVGQWDRLMIQPII